MNQERRTYDTKPHSTTCMRIFTASNGATHNLVNPPATPPAQKSQAFVVLEADPFPLFVAWAVGKVSLRGIGVPEGALLSRPRHTLVIPALLGVTHRVKPTPCTGGLDGHA